MKKNKYSKYLLAFIATTAFSSDAVEACNGDVVIISGKSYCKTDKEDKRFPVCGNGYSINPEDPYQCIKMPRVEIIDDITTSICPEGSVPKEGSETTCIKEFEKTTTSIEDNYNGTWHAFSLRNGSKFSFKSEESEKYLEAMEANNKMNVESKYIECDEDVWVDSTVNNLKYGFYTGSDEDKWKIDFAKVVSSPSASSQVSEIPSVPAYSDGKSVSEYATILKYSFIHEPIVYDTTGDIVLSNGDTYPIEFVPNDSFSYTHSFYVDDGWDVLSEWTEELQDIYKDQKFTESILTSNIQMGVAGVYEYSRGISSNNMITDKGIKYSLKRALEPMKPGNWIETQNDSLGEAGYCFSPKELSDETDSYTTECGETGSGNIIWTITPPTDSCDLMLKEREQKKEVSVSLTCCQSESSKEVCSTCEEDDEDCTVTCSDVVSCDETETWSDTKEIKVYEAWTRLDAGTHKSNITVNSGECDSVTIEKPSLQEDFCVPDNGWDSVYNGERNSCSKKVISKYRYHVDKAIVPHYCSNVGLVACGKYSIDSNSDGGTNFAYCSSDPSHNPEPDSSTYIESAKWWGWDVAFSDEGISPSFIKGDFHAASDAHHQCQKDACELKTRTCEQANDEILRATITAELEELAESNAMLDNKSISGASGYINISESSSVVDTSGTTTPSTTEIGESTSYETPMSSGEVFLDLDFAGNRF